MSTPPGPAVLSERDHTRFGDLVRTRSGLEVTEARRPDLARAVWNALADTAAPDTDALYERLTSQEGRLALETLVAALTIGETHFFRNRPQFEALEQRILPDLIARRRAVRRLRLWSAGCASGEEAYSLAILLERLLPDLEKWSLLILATDINRQALERARRGVYSQWSFREVPPDIQSDYFSLLPRTGAQAPSLEVAPRVRYRVTLAYLNLIEDTYPSLLTNTHAMDLILCRNVFIYFREAVVRRVAGRFYDALAEGGWLIVGHAEPSQTLFHQFRVHNLPGTVVYQKVGAGKKETGAETAWARIETVPAQAVPPLPLAPAHPRPESAAPVRTAPSSPSSMAPPLPAAPSGAQADLARIAGMLDAGQSDAARQQLEALAASAPQEAGATYLLAKLHANQLQLKSAQDWIDETLRRAPLMAAAHYLHSLILVEEGRLEYALAALRRCVYADPQYVLGHFALAGLMVRQGQGRRAHKALENVARLLAGRRPDDLIPDGDGLTVGRLLELVAIQRQS